MTIIRLAATSLLAALSSLLALTLTAAPAQAQATRTWVSGVGNDANPCSRTAPCRTFAGAIIKTATGGEINCLDPGGYGGVTINKSLSIICNYTEGGGLVAGAGVNGIVINATASSHVYLRGIDLFGVGSAQNGIRFLVGASLTIEDSVIRGFSASNGIGVQFVPTGAASLVLKNVTVSNNGNGASGGGVLVQPGVAGGASVVIQDSIISNNTGFGISGTGAAVNVRVGNTQVFSNSTGIATSGGATIASFGNNMVEANGVDGAFNGTVPNK